MYGDLTAVPSYKRVFVTSTTHDGDMNDEGGTGLTGADAICQAREDEQSLGGTWKAWLSTDSVAAKDRIPDSEYRLVDGTTIVANSKADLLDGTLDNPVAQTESGGAPPVFFGFTHVSTGTLVDGTVDGAYHCTAWTQGDGFSLARLGDATEAGSQWTYGGSSGCQVTWPIYCFEM